MYQGPVYPLLSSHLIEALLLLGCESAPEKIGIESSPIAAAVVGKKLPEVVEG